MEIMSLDAGINVARMESLCIHARFLAYEAEQDGDRNYGDETTCDLIRILMVEDNPGDVQLTIEAIMRWK